METKNNLSITMRPASLDQMIGNEGVVAALQKRLDAGEVPAAILLTGPFGTGKTTLAYIIARAVQGFDFPPNKQPHIQEVDAANYTGVDAMRGLLETTGTFPMPPSKYRVIVMDEIHRLSKQAQDLLLKELEAPKKPTIYVFATSEIGKINGGILSRCLKYETRGLNPAEIAILVARAAKAKERKAPFDDFLKAVADKGMTSPRFILNAFETYNDGMSAEEALSAAGKGMLPEFFDIGFAVCFGKWNTDVTLEWAAGKLVKSVRSQLEALDGKLKKKPAVEGEETRADDTAEVDKEDALGRNETARGLRAVVAAFLKGQILKPKTTPAKGIAFADALNILVQAAPTNEFDVALEFPATVAALLRVMVRIKASEKDA